MNTLILSPNSHFKLRRGARPASLILIIVLLLAVAVSSASAITIVVNSANDSGPGSLRNAVTIAPTGATITFAAALSGQTIVLTSGSITLTTNVTIDASALANPVQLNGNHASQIFLVNYGATVVLNSLTITNGSSDDGGGLENNGTLTVNNSTFVNNGASENGGGIFNGGTLTVNYSTFASNNATIGGGIHNFGGTVTVNNSTLVNNSSSNVGGGIENDGALMVNNSTLANNSGYGGGGIYNTLRLTVDNGTLANNTAAIGGGIYNNTSSTLNLTNSVVCSNTATASSPNINGSITSGANNLVGANALLASLGNYGGPTQTMPPLPGSPAIDAGDAAAASSFAYDQRGIGFPRLSGSHVDIGAVEEQDVVTVDPPWLTDLVKLGDGTFQFSFTNFTGASFHVWATTNVALPFNAWLNLGSATETPSGSGHFQFTDPQATTNPQRFYRVESP